MRNNFERLGCPNWDNAAVSDSDTLTVFNFGLDAGPDNQGAVRRVASSLDGVSGAMFSVTWCFFHQHHLIMKYLLTILESWEWEEDGPWPCKFFSALSVIATVWRSTGNARVIENKCAMQFNTEVAARCCSKSETASVSVGFH